MVVQGYVAQQCLLQIQPTLEAMAFEDIGNSPIEAFDHAIGARRSGLGQPVFNAQAGTQQIELMLSCGLARSRCKKPICELLAVVGEHLLNAHRTSLVHCIEKRFGTGRGLVLLDLHEHPAGSAVDGHEQVAPAALILHLWQVLQIDVQVSRLVSLECLAHRCGLLGLERIEIAHPMATQAAVQTRASGLGADELAGDRQQVIKGQQQGATQFDHNALLSRRQGGLQVVRRVRSVMHAGALLPLAGRLFGDAIAPCQHDYAVGAGRYLSSNGRRGACVLVQRDHHEKPPEVSIERPSRSSTNWRIASRAASKGYLLGSMQSSGMRQVNTQCRRNALNICQQR